MKDLNFKKLLVFLLMLSLTAFLTISCQSDDDDDNDGSSPTIKYDSPLLGDGTKEQYADQALTDASWDAVTLQTIDNSSDANNMTEEVADIFGRIMEEKAEIGMSAPVKNKEDMANFSSTMNATITTVIDSTGDCESGGTYIATGSSQTTLEEDEDRTYRRMSMIVSIDFELDECQTPTAIVYGKGKAKYSRVFDSAENSASGIETIDQTVKGRLDGGFAIEVSAGQYKVSLGYGVENIMEATKDPSNDYQRWEADYVMSVNDFDCTSHILEDVSFDTYKYDYMPEPEWNCTN